MVPLEEAVSKNRSSSGHHVDNERERTYNLAGSVDAQIKLLAQDLREVYTSYWWTFSFDIQIVLWNNL